MRTQPSWVKVMVALVATALGAVLLSSCDLMATCTVHWDGPASGNYAVAANWDTDSVPTPAQHACAEEGTTITISTPVETGRFTSLGTVSVSASGRLTATDALVVETLVVRGTLAGSGAVAAGRFDLRTGTVEGSGPITALGPSTSVDGVTVRGSRALVLNGLIWGGTIRLCETSTLALRGTVRTTQPAGVTTAGCPAPGTPTFTVEPGATLHLGSTLTTDLPLRVAGTLAGSGSIVGAVVNAGTITPGAPTVPFTFTNYVGQIQIQGSYTAEAGALLIVDLKGDAANQRDLVTVDANTTLGSTALIVRQGPNFFPPVSTTYDALVVTGGHTLAPDLPTPFVAFGPNGHWSRSITGGTALTLTVVACPVPGNFVGADLRDADLRACELERSDFTGADLTGANFTGARLDGSTFTGAVMDGTLLGASLLSSISSPGIRSGGIIGTPAALPTGMKLIDGYLVGPGSNLSGEDLSGSTIVGVDLTGARLQGVVLTGVVSSGITFTPEVCQGRFCVSVAPGFSPGTMLRGGHLIGPGVDLRGVDLTGEDLSGADLTSITIGGADLTGTTGPGNGSGAAMVYDPSSPTRCSDGTLTGSAGVTTCAGRGPGW